jgi:hypothetical protein
MAGKPGIRTTPDEIELWESGAGVPDANQLAAWCYWTQHPLEDVTVEARA